MAPGPLDTFITYRLARANARLNAQAAIILRDACGLSLAQWRVLSLIADGQPTTLSAMARRSGIDKGQISRGLKGLLADRLVAQAADAADHRIQHLSLTAGGQALHAAMLPRMRRRQERLFAALDHDERRVILSALAKLEQAADKTE